MLEAVQQLMAAKAQVQANPGASVTVSLDLDDPKAQTLIKFAKKLMLPTTKIRASGLTIKTGMEISENADEFIEELRKIVGDEVMDELSEDLLQQMAIDFPSVT